MPSAPDGFPADQLCRISQETFVEHLEFSSEMGSTNDRALELIATGTCPAPLLVLTARQTGGRGRGTNPWWAGPGALTCSLIIDPDRFHISADRQPQMSLTLGLAVCRTIDRFAPSAEVGLKWPNDVHVNGRKACGILCEVPGRGQNTSPSASPLMVLGIGLNVNNRMTDAPQDLQSQAIALIDISQRPLPLIDVVIDLLKQVAIQLHTLATDRDGLLNRWSEFDVLRNRRIWLKTCSGEACGISRGIDTDGALLLQTDDGIERFLSATVVKWV